MARIDYAVSMSAIQSTTLEGNTFEAIDEEIGKSLSGGKSDTTWAGSAIEAWAAGDHTHISSNGGTGNTITVNATSDGLWIKHTGFKFDGGITTTAETDSELIVLAVGDAAEVCRLASGQAIFLPSPKNGVWKVKDDTAGEVVAVEVANLT